MKPSYIIKTILEVDARYIWIILAQDNSVSFRSSTRYNRENDAEKAAYDFAAKHNLAIGQVTQG